MKLLLAQPLKFQNQEDIDFLKEQKFQVNVISSGKEVQKHLVSGENKYDVLVIDSEIEDYTFLPLVKFCNLTTPRLMLLFILRKSTLIELLNINEKKLYSFGVSSILDEDDWSGLVFDFIKKSHYSSWKDVTALKAEEVDEVSTREMLISDKSFTEVGIDSFLQGSPAIFDIYIRLSKDKYIKLIRQGEIIEPSRVKHYKDKFSITLLYFKTEERMVYINYINELIKNIPDGKNLEGTKLKLISNVSEEFVKEIYIEGLDRKCYEEGMKITENMYNVVTSIPSLKEMMDQFSYETISHHFLTALYAMAIGKDVDWVGQKTMQNISMGCLIHDVGMLKVPWYKESPDKDTQTLEGEDLEEYKKHPLYGFEMLQDLKHIPESVKQIVLHHHEYFDGTGFPYSKLYKRIYPLARIVSLANYMSDWVIREKKPLPILAKVFLRNHTEIRKFDPVFIKAFIRNIEGVNYEEKK